MASKKTVKKKVSRRSPRRDDAALYAQFIADLVAGLLGVVVQLYTSRNAQGELEIEYDEETDA